MVDASGVPDQRYEERLSHPALRDVISCVFVQEVSALAPPYTHRSVPNGSVVLSYRLGSVVPLVTGPQRVPDVYTLEPGSSVVGVRFRPGAANPILGISASELIDRREELDAIWGSAADSLGARLADATSAQEAAALLEDALIGRVVDDAPQFDAVVGELVERLQPWRARRVTDQATDLFLSPRQLRRWCLDTLGFGPKALHRILRFHGFMALADLDQGAVDLASAALAAGYADQAHLTRECVRLSGLTPRAFLSERAENCLGSHDHLASLLQMQRAFLQARAA